MNSKQVKIFQMHEEFDRLIKYVKNNDMLVVASPMKNNKLKFVESAENHLYDFLYIFHKSDLKNIKIISVGKKKLHYIDIFASPVIELYTGVYNKKKNYLTRGRLYFIGENNGKTKSKKFLKTADKLIKWFKKNYKNSKIKNYESIIISKKVKQWTLKDSGKLIDN